VRRELSSQRARQSDDRERDDRGGERDVRDEHREVRRADPSAAREAHITNLVVIEQVRDEEEHRYGERSDHTDAMRADVAALDEDEACEQQDRGDAIEYRVQRRE
jgi:hypothetical protein